MPDGTGRLRIRVLNAFRHHRVLRTLKYCPGGIQVLVLNAFRHHRVLRPDLQLFRRRLLPVLNAFRHHRVLRSEEIAMICPHCSAQRLSASQGATRGGVRLSNPSDECSTPFGITGCYARLWTGQGTLVYECSTPFGITGCYATSRPCSIHIGRVLNAFRHHRVLRPGSPWGPW